jgi:hypothetical protein
MYLSKIELKTSWKHTKVLTIKPLQHFINKDEKFEFIMFGMKIVSKIQTLTYIFFLAKFIQMLQMKKMILKHIQ